MKKLLTIGFLISLIACNQNKSAEKTNSEKENAKATINAMLSKMYVGDRESKSPLEDTLLFSKEIVALNTKCDSITQLDTKRIAHSNSPSDKPLLREGSAISSLYEGVTDYKINKINDNGKNIEVLVTLSNKFYKDQKPWKERIVFSTEGGLKIDDIYFDQNLANASSLKNYLKSFSQQKIQ
jgi:hypothetical protein